MNGPRLFDPLERGETRAKLRERIFQFIQEREANGAINAEIQTALGLSGDSERPRRLELEREGLIQNSHRTRLSPSGLPCIFWILAKSSQKPAEPSPAIDPPHAAPTPHGQSSALKRQSQTESAEREKTHGGELDAASPNGLGRLCEALFPDWPKAFEMKLSPEAARTDLVCRRLLLVALAERIRETSGGKR